MPTEQDAERLAMARRREALIGSWAGAMMATLYLESHTDDYQTVSAVRPLLIPSRNTQEAINSPGWLSVSRNPGPVSQWDDDGQELVAYHRFGNDDGLEPLVLVREFNDLKDPYVEVSEEFRLFHNLYHDQQRHSYIKIDDSGQETVVVEVRPRSVAFRILEVRQYLAIRDMHLLVQFDFHERSPRSLAELSLTPGETTHHDDQSNWRLLFTELDRDDHVAFARFIGKRLLAPVDKTSSGFPGFSDDTKHYVDFIVGHDDQGREVTASCNPAQLPRYTADGPEFFTPVSFRKSVLDRYYSQHSKFKVSDGMLSCGNLWMLSIDDDHDDHICVWLGDLGDVLPYAEQLHWRAHNILVPGGPVSPSFFDRQFAGKFADSHRPEHQFRDLYRRLAETSRQQLGWPLLMPLHDKDTHRLASIRVPGSDEQPAFDDQIQGLATILIDSLNKRHMEALLPQTERPHPKGTIDLLESLLRTRAIHGYQPHIGLLRTLQSLRSSGSAHRKGTNFDKHAAKVRLDELGPQRVIANLIDQSVDLLRFLLGAVQCDQIAAEAGARGSD